MTHVEPLTVRLAFFGSSTMEHFEAYSPRLTIQSALPEVGESVLVEGWHRRGYLYGLRLALQIAWPAVRFSWDNRAVGGATSRDLVEVVREYGDRAGPAGLVFLSCGVNDVWRRFQGRDSEAVPLQEYAANYGRMLETLTGSARRVICIAETPFGWDLLADADAMNQELSRYNDAARRTAVMHGADFIDVWPAFMSMAEQLGTGEPPSAANPTLWSDGAHLSELGDTLLLRLVQDHLAAYQVFPEVIAVAFAS